jgi:hypothetical protein
MLRRSAWPYPALRKNGALWDHQTLAGSGLPVMWSLYSVECASRFTHARVDALRLCPSLRLLVNLSTRAHHPLSAILLALTGGIFSVCAVPLDDCRNGLYQQLKV